MALRSPNQLKVPKQVVLIFSVLFKSKFKIHLNAGERFNCKKKKRLIVLQMSPNKAKS